MYLLKWTFHLLPIILSFVFLIFYKSLGWLSCVGFNYELIVFIMLLASVSLIVQLDHLKNSNENINDIINNKDKSFYRFLLKLSKKSSILIWLVVFVSIGYGILYYHYFTKSICKLETSLPCCLPERTKFLLLNNYFLFFVLIVLAVIIFFDTMVVYNTEKFYTNKEFREGILEKTKNNKG